MKKTIRIVGWSLGENSFGVTKPYLEFFSQFGQVEVLTPREGMSECDLLVLPGGADLSSIEYGEVPGFMNTNPDLYKEYFYKQNLQQYIDAKIPIVGICLGMQMLAVKFGSKLTQNLLYHPYYSKTRDELVHDIYPVIGYDEERGWLHREPKDKKDKNRIEVNSMHHQGVELSNLSEDLIPTYLTDYYLDMLVEGFKHRELPILGYQHHPEECYSPHVIDEIENLLKENEKKILQNK